MTAAKNVREALLPCPFCNSVDVTVGYDGQPARMVYVVCSVCGAQGPYERSDQTQFTGLYVEYWNTRKLSATAAGDAKLTGIGDPQSLPADKGCDDCPKAQSAAALYEAAKSAEAFIGVMFGRVDGSYPATVDTHIGVPVKLGEIMRDLETAIAAQESP